MLHISFSIYLSLSLSLSPSLFACVRVRVLLPLAAFNTLCDSLVQVDSMSRSQYCFCTLNTEPAVAGLLCKEQGITCVVVCAVYDAIVVTGIDLRALLHVRTPCWTACACILEEE
jgi:hypothetical protein